jgi:hypothetical protein
MKTPIDRAYRLIALACIGLLVAAGLVFFHTSRVEAAKAVGNAEGFVQGFSLGLQISPRPTPQKTF